MGAKLSRPFLVWLLGYVSLQACSAPVEGARATLGQQPLADQYLAQLDLTPLRRTRQEVASRFGLPSVYARGGLDVRVPGAGVQSRAHDILALLSQPTNIVLPGPSPVSRVALAAPNDPAYHELIGDLYVQWPARALDVLIAWDRYPGCYFDAASRPREAPIVALIDTGVDAAHPDFMNIGAASADVSEGGQLLLSSAGAFLGGNWSGEATDEHGHGTHLAGLIAAAANNGTTAGSGIAGIGYPLRLLPLKVAGPNGVATHADIAEAIIYAADVQSAVIIVGLAGPTWSPTLQEAVDYAWERGCLIVAPAGDAGEGFPVFPAGCPHVFGVAAVTASGATAHYSGSGDHVALSAPGGDEVVGVYSTLPTYACTLREDLSGPAYGWLFGTSQAAAHVAAAAALYAGQQEIRPETGDEGVAVWQALQRRAASPGDTGGAEWDADVGYGMLDAPGLLSSDEWPIAGTGSIVGRVLLGGEPGIGASVAAIPEGGGPPAYVITTWPAGGYRIASLLPGVYRVIAQAEDMFAERAGVIVVAGCDVPGTDFRLGDRPVGAALLAGDIPLAAVRGQSVEFSLTFANTGESSWRRADGYRLEQTDPESPISIVPDHVDLAPGETIPPGQARTFTVSLPVPDEFGFYETAWQMCQQGGAGLFGEVASGTVSVTSFLDVSADHWAVWEIEAAKEAGIVCGYEGDLYRPASAVSRDQMAVYLARALAGGDQEVPAGPGWATFADVGMDHWAHRYIEYVCERGVVQGYEDGLYHPDHLVDRGQMAIFVARALAGGASGLADYRPPEIPTFEDVATESWSYRGVEYLAALGIIAGYPDDLYHPEYICSRDQIAVYLARAFNLASASSLPL